MDRRGFLGAMIGAFLAGCTQESSEPLLSTTSSTTGQASTSTPRTSSALPTTTPPTSVDALEAPEVALPADAFQLGVASGEPDATSVLLWARFLGDLPTSFEAVWEVAIDAEMSNLVATGLALVDEATAHSVHVVADGLAADQRFFYRFRAGELTSPIGQTRTLPTDDDARAITLGFSSCQARSDGAWAAHRDLANTNVDAVIWLGDYIYGDYDTLDEYRGAYVEYRSDPLIQACHGAHPWISFIDDHEVVNDFDASVDPARRSAALQAWWEHQPTRLPPPSANASYPLFRSFDLGGAARLIGLDTRQFADDASLLGDDQWAFLEQASTHDAANTLVASPVIISGLRDLEGAPLVPYSIDARPDERARLAELLGGVPTPTIVSGDLHTSLVADFSADPLDRTQAPIAVEIMAPAISSSFPERFAPLAPFLPLVNPQVRSIEIANGWLELSLGTGERAAWYHFVDDVSDAASSVTVRPIPDL